MLGDVGATAVAVAAPPPSSVSMVTPSSAPGAVAANGIDIAATPVASSSLMILEIPAQKLSVDAMTLAAGIVLITSSKRRRRHQLATRFGPLCADDAFKKGWKLYLKQMSRLPRIVSGQASPNYQRS